MLEALKFNHFAELLDRVVDKVLLVAVTVGDDLPEELFNAFLEIILLALFAEVAKQVKLR